MTEYNQLCYEDDKTNRLTESIELFDEITNSIFKDIDIVLCLTKKDLFKKKIKSEDISLNFKDYSDDTGDYDKVLSFIKNKFLSTNKYNNRMIHIFDLNLLDKDEVKYVFDEIIKVAQKNKKLMIDNKI